MVGQQDHLGRRLQHPGRQIDEMGPDEVHAAQNMGIGELGAGAAGLLIRHQVADVVHQGSDQRCIDVVGVQSLAGEVQAVQHARRAKHHFVGVAAVVVKGFELLVARQFAVEGAVEQAEGAE
jgi:hypothetical protein